MAIYRSRLNIRVYQETQRYATGALGPPPPGHTHQPMREFSRRGPRYSLPNTTRVPSGSSPMEATAPARQRPPSSPSDRSFWTSLFSPRPMHYTNSTPTVCTACMAIGVDLSPPGDDSERMIADRRGRKGKHRQGAAAPPTETELYHAEAIAGAACSGIVVSLYISMSYRSDVV